MNVSQNQTSLIRSHLLTRDLSSNFKDQATSGSSTTAADAIATQGSEISANAYLNSGLAYASGSWGNVPIFNNLEEAIAGLGLEVELDDPELVTDYGENDDGTPIVIPGEYIDIDGEVFVDGASLADVQQGRIGNCYLMAAVASIAEHNPEFLEQLITDNGDGTYTVHFQGGLGDVTVDDDFPVFVGTDNTIYSETNTGGSDAELWVAIIEKAYAQANGGYQETVGGRTHEALAEITGQSSFTTGAPSSIPPEQMQQALANDQSVTVSSLTTDQAKKADLGTGIISGHAYVVTEVRQNDAGEWEIVVYNPWGSDQATGDGNSDGFTVLSMEEFNSNFRDVQIMDDPIALAA